MEPVKKIDSDYIILATGSKPRNLPNIEPDEDFIITSDTALNWEEPPKKFVSLVLVQLVVNLQVC